MLTQQTLEKMNVMKLSAMAEAFEHQLGSGEHAKLSFEEQEADSTPPTPIHANIRGARYYAAAEEETPC